MDGAPGHDRRAFVTPSLNAKCALKVGHPEISGGRKSGLRMGIREGNGKGGRLRVS